MKTMKDYHDLYLKCDILLLADVFGKFIVKITDLFEALFEHTRFEFGCNT